MKQSHSLTYFLLLQCKFFLSSISNKSRHKISCFIANVLYNHFKIRKVLARKNLKRAFPNWSDKKLDIVLRKNYLFFTEIFIDFISIPKSWEKIKVEVTGEKILKSFLTKGNGIIMISGHFGCWDILGKWLSEHSPLFTGVAQRQKNKGADKFAIEQREIPGTKHIFRKEPIEKMYDVLSKNGILGLISDQDAKKRGVFVNFFNKLASTPKGAAIFHINTNAPIILGVCIKISYQNYKIKLIPVDTSKKDIGFITQQYTIILENIIRRYPEQYFWFHRRWKSQPL